MTRPRQKCKRRHYAEKQLTAQQEVPMDRGMDIKARDCRIYACFVVTFGLCVKFTGRRANRTKIKM